MPENNTSLKDILLETKQKEASTEEKFQQILKRQQNNFIALLFMMFVALGVFIAIITKPVQVDRELIRHIEQERAYIVSERRRQDMIDQQQLAKDKQILEDRKVLNAERATIITARAQILEAQRILAEQRKLLLAK